MAVDVLHDFLQHDPKMLKPLREYFARESASAASVVGTLIVWKHKDGFSYRKFWPETECEHEGVKYTEWEHFCDFISAADCRDYELEELVRTDIHEWTGEEKAELTRWYNHFR